MCIRDSAFQTADKQVKQATTTRDAFLKSQKAVSAAQEVLVELRVQQKLAREEISRLDRIRRVAPQFQSLTVLEATLPDFADIEDLADNLATEIWAAIKSVETDREALERAEEAFGRIEAQLSELMINDEIVEAGPDIEEADRLATNVESARRSMPKRLGELADVNAKLDSLRRLLEVGPEEDLEARAPSRAAIEEVRSLASAAVTLNADIKTAEKHLEEIRDNLASLHQKQTEREACGFDLPAPVSALELSTLTSRARDLEIRRAQFAKSQSSIDADALALDISSVSDLSRHNWPSVVDVKHELEAVGLLETERRDEQVGLKASTRRAEQAASRLASLAAGTEPPVPSVVAEARSARNSDWSEIRAAYLDSPDDDWQRPPAQERAAHASQFERAQDLADRLVDRRDAEAQRLADIVAVEREKVEADRESERVRSAITDIEAKIELRKQAWVHAWASDPVIAGDLRRLASYAESREAIIERQEKLDASRLELVKLATEVEGLTQMLLRAEEIASLDPEPSLAARVQNAVATLKKHEDFYGDYRRDAEALTTLKSREERGVEAIARLASARDEWSANWSQKIVVLGLSPNATADLASEVASEWLAAAGIFSAINLASTRIRRINEDPETLRKQLVDLRTRVRVELPEDDVAAAHQLKLKLQESSRQAHKREALLPEHEKARFDKEAAEKHVATSVARLDHLAATSRCKPESLKDTADRIKDRSKLRIDIDALKQTIITAGDGTPLDALKVQWQEQDPDQLAARLAELKQDVDRRDTEIEAAIAAQQAAETEARAFLDDDGLNGLFAERESASADMHRIIERYVEISLAKFLLEEAIEKVRAEQQDPLLVRASELFANSTRGEFTGIDTDVSQDGEPIVVGRRPNGSNVHLSEMSDGTRDQLFLAFRLASVEHYSQNAEPLPLVADDVLVHFDDDRGRATLELLAELGSTTQVLLFTHHESVLAAASGLVAEGRASIVKLHR